MDIDHVSHVHRLMFLPHTDLSTHLAIRIRVVESRLAGEGLVEVPEGVELDTMLKGIE